MNVRPILPRDLPAAIEIRLEALRDSPDAYGTTYDECVHRSPEEWEQWLSRGPIYVCEDEGRVVGMVQGGGSTTYDECVHRSPEEWEQWLSRGPIYVCEDEGRVVGMVQGGGSEFQPEDRFLYAMYVTPSARGTAAATMLVDYVSAWAVAQGRSSIFLHVVTRQERAVAFYEKMGFRPTGQRITMQRDPSLELITMERPLPWTFRVATVPAAELYAVRRRVLRNNDPAVTVRDARDNDSSAQHYAGLIGDRVVVTASIYPSTSPTSNEVTTYQLRYMATDFDVQGRGLAHQVLRTIYGALAARGVTQLWANGRDTAWGFYEREGWREMPDSAHLSPETQLPHHRIMRDITAADAG